MVTRPTGVRPTSMGPFQRKCRCQLASRMGQELAGVFFSTWRAFDFRIDNSDVLVRRSPFFILPPR